SVVARCLGGINVRARLSLLAPIKRLRYVPDRRQVGQSLGVVLDRLSNLIDSVQRIRSSLEEVRDRLGNRRVRLRRRVDRGRGRGGFINQFVRIGDYQTRGSRSNL